MVCFFLGNLSFIFGVRSTPIKFGMIKKFWNGMRALNKNFIFNQQKKER